MAFKGVKAGRLAAICFAALAALGQARALEVVDAEGRVVGPVVGVGEPVAGLVEAPRVAFRTADGRLFTLLAGADRFESQTAILYKSTDCNGTPYVPVMPAETPFLPVAILPPGNTLYRPAADAEPQDVEVRAVRVLGSECRAIESAVGAQIIVGLPLAASVDLLERYKPPFSVRADPEDDVPTVP